MSKRVKTHLLFCSVTLLLFMVQSLVDRRGAVFGYILFLSSVYFGRWISGQSYAANWFDMLRMFFLSFFFLTITGLVGFVRYVEPGMRITHYFESWINISVFVTFCLLSGFFVHRIRKRYQKNSDAEVVKI